VIAHEVENKVYKHHKDAIDLVKEYKETMKKSSIVSYKDQDTMRTLRTDISRQLLKLESHQKWLEELLKDEDKMALMHLSKLQSIPDAYRLVLISPQAS
jgi:hypothetical protein